MLINDLEGYTDEKDFIRFFGSCAIYQDGRTGRCCGVAAEIFSKGIIRCARSDTEVYRD